jgi:hypothetical protein
MQKRRRLRTYMSTCPQEPRRLVEVEASLLELRVQLSFKALHGALVDAD